MTFNLPATDHIAFRQCDVTLYGGADKSLALPTSRCILFDVENISFASSLVYIFIYIYTYIHMYIKCTNIPPIMIINRLYEIQNLLSL